jgi:hypothetical protein
MAVPGVGTSWQKGEAVWASFAAEAACVFAVEQAAEKTEVSRE